jgi:hypothetical protein
VTARDSSVASAVPEPASQAAAPRRSALWRLAVDLLCAADTRTAAAALAGAGRWLSPALPAGRLLRAWSDEISAGLIAHGQRVPRGLARELTSRHMMDRLLTAKLRRRGLPVLVDLVEGGSREELNRLRTIAGPRVAVTWHLGPPYGLLAAFRQAELPAMGVIRRPYDWTVEYASFVCTAGGPDARMAALWTATQYLRDGGIVVIAADGLEGERTAVFNCVGRRMSFGRGPFVLARLSGAVVVPTVSCWEPGGRIGVRVGTPLQVSRTPAMSGVDYENALAMAAARWFEEYVTTHPAELRPHSLRWLCSYPRASAWARSEAQSSFKAP